MRHLILACTILSAAPVAAQDLDCSDAMTQTEMTFCAEQDWMEADADLNDAYASAQDVMWQIDSELPQSERGAEINLKEGQRAWVVFRDKVCAAEGYIMHGGSAEPMLVYGCRARLTRVRAEDLWQMAQPY